MFEHVTDTKTLERFLAKVDGYPDETVCWNWLAYKSWRGYGRFWYGGQQQLAHRISYLLAHGKLTTELEIDHTCHNTSCVNPLHLEEVDHPTNSFRGALANRDKTHCKRGHGFTPENTYTYKYLGYPSRRACRTCNREKRRSK